jgi:GntR family transcriptional regulator/MocR family aminotransferase
MERPSPWSAPELTLDRASPASLADQIVQHVEAAIYAGSLQPGRRLPSWRDLAAQLGVARGTVRAAYERLTDKGLLVAFGSAGTRIIDPVPERPGPKAAEVVIALPKEIRHRADPPLAFQMGIPAQDAFPATVWARLHRQAVQETALRNGHTDPRGLGELRSALASHLALARGIECSPEQVIVTSGYRAGLALSLAAIGAAGKTAWMEEPGYPITRFALKLAGVSPIGIPVDEEGIRVSDGRELAPDALAALVTPGQQAPTGVALSENRRAELLQWANDRGGWVIEDDYLAELHLSGRSARALAAEPGGGRVIHIGTFSKTISPAIGLGFVVAPQALARRMVEIATLLGTPPSPAIQSALANFLVEGHYLRHLRRMRRLYVSRREMLLETLANCGVEASAAGLSVFCPLPIGPADQQLCDLSRDAGLALTPYSTWFANPDAAPGGLLLGIANILERSVRADCERLVATAVVDRNSPVATAAI